MILLWPQILTIINFGLSLFLYAILNGRDRDGEKYNFALKLCDIGLCVWILYMGGYWTGGAR